MPRWIAKYKGQDIFFHPAEELAPIPVYSTPLLGEPYLTREAIQKAIDDRLAQLRGEEEARHHAEVTKPLLEAEREQAIEIAELHERAEELHKAYLEGRITPDHYERELGEVNRRLRAIGVPIWTPPPPPPPVEEKPEQVSAEAPWDIKDIMSQYAKLEIPDVDHALAIRLESLLRAQVERVGLIPEAVASTLTSPINREKAAMMARTLGVSIISAIAALNVTGIVAESVSFGQIESVTHAVDSIIRASGIGYLGSLLAVLQFESGLIEPARQYWRSVYLPSIPGASDLIRFVVREVITYEEFEEWMKYHGFSVFFSEAYWEAHWVLPAFESLREAFWRGIINLEEFKKYIVWHDYKPEPRPGIRLSDQDIIARLSYRLPGRIETRWMRRWGIIGDREMVVLLRMDGLHPEWLGRVVEGERMNMLIDERTALKTIYIRQFRIGLIDEEELRSKLKALYYSPDEVEWIVQRALIEYQIDLLDDLVAAAKAAFRKDVISEEEFLDMLLTWGIPEERARPIVSRETFMKLPRPEKAKLA